MMFFVLSAALVAASVLAPGPLFLYTGHYQTMAYRLMVLGGASAAPVNNTYLVSVRDRADVAGRTFCEVAERRVFETADAAKSAAETSGAGFQVVGLTAWQPAFPVPAITGLRLAQEFREPGQKPNETPMIRIFEVMQK